MNVKLVTRSDEWLEKWEGEAADMCEIWIDGKKQFSVYDGEPEDSNLSRNFSSCFDIPFLMKQAWEAGKRGEDFTTGMVEENG